MNGHNLGGIVVLAVGVFAFVLLVIALWPERKP